MPTDDLAATALLGVLVALVAFEFVAATTSWLAAARSPRQAAPPVLWLSRPAAVRRHLESRRREFDAIRRQYPMLRSARHGHEIRKAIRRVAQPMDAMPVVRPIACRALPTMTPAAILPERA
jgi:hypothetical protein